jgi:hypothetical protein
MTMGFNVATFQSFLDEGFEHLWNTAPIPRNNVSELSVPCISQRSLDAAGALGLLLHFLNSTMVETSLVQIFAIIPTIVLCYILHVMPDGCIQWLHSMAGQ